MIYKSREDLEKKLINFFSQKPEVYGIATFGREVEGKTDKYSDIDLVVCSTDLALTFQEYREVISKISPILQVFPLQWDQPDNYAEMLILKDYSPYQKIDFSFVDDLERKRQFGPFKILYKEKNKKKRSKSTIPHIEYKKDAVYKMNDILFSVPRFTKCLYRQDIDMYRRWKGITNSLLVLLYEKYFGWQVVVEKKELNAPEVKKLMENLEVNDRRILDVVFPKTGNLDVMASYLESIKLFVSITKIKCNYFGLKYPDNFVKYMLSFLTEES